MRQIMIPQPFLCEVSPKVEERVSWILPLRPVDGSAHRLRAYFSTHTRGPDCTLIRGPLWMPIDIQDAQSARGAVIEGVDKASRVS